ncbi:MAG: hypothetical protein DDT33_01676 [Firmicutes bacterium]|nr:hypothetical protein [Bacillota bacterium]
MCKGTTKLGVRCRRTVRRAYEIEPGNLYVPLTCHLHSEQEEAIRDKLDKQVNYMQA